MSMELEAEIQDKVLRTIAGKVRQNIPVDRAEARYMLTTSDILDLGKIAHYLRTRFHADNAYYGVNMNLNYTNICELRCPLCAYSCDENDREAFTLSLDEVETMVRRAVSLGIDEVHIVGGLHPALKLEYFEEVLRR